MASVAPLLALATWNIILFIAAAVILVVALVLKKRSQ